MILGTNSIKKTKQANIPTKNIFSDDTTQYGFLQKQWLYFKKYFIRTKKKLKYSLEENRLHFKAYYQDFYRGMILLKIVLLH